jgi:hypothetical protein
VGCESLTVPLAIGSEDTDGHLDLAGNGQEPSAARKLSARHANAAGAADIGIDKGPRDRESREGRETTVRMWVGGLGR